MSNFKTLSNDPYRNGGPFRYRLSLAMFLNIVGRVQILEILSFPGTKCQSEMPVLDRISLTRCIIYVGNRVFSFLINLRTVYELLQKYNLLI